MSAPRVAHALAAALAFLVAAGAYLALAWTDELVSVGGDSATYLLTAQHFAGINEPVSAHFARASFYPPLYPLLLAAAGGAASLLIANLVTTACLLLAFVALYAYARRAELRSWTALLVVIAFMAAPGTYLQTVMAQSENLSLLLSLLAVASGAAYERDGRPRQLAFLAVCAALTALTRSAGVALLLALLLRGLALRRPAIILAAVLGWLPVLAWGWLHPGEAGYAKQLALPHDVAGIAGFVQSQLATWLKLWPSNFGVSRFALWLLWLITAVGLVGAATRALRGRFDGLYCCVYLGICLVWPFPVEAQRLLFVVEPVLLVQAFLVFQAWAERLAERSTPRFAWSPGFIAMLLVITMLPNLALAIERYRQVPPEAERFRHRPEWYAGHFGPEDYAARDQLVQAMRDLNARAGLGPDDCVYAVKPSLVAFHSGHFSYPPPPEAFDDAAFRQALTTQPCGYFLLMGSTPGYPTFFYPLERLKDAVEIVALYSLPRADGSPRHVAALARWRAIPAPP